VLDQEIVVSHIKADRFPFPCEGDITLAVRNANYALGPVMFPLFNSPGLSNERLRRTAQTVGLPGCCTPERLDDLRFLACSLPPMKLTLHGLPHEENKRASRGACEVTPEQPFHPKLHGRS